MPNPVFKGLQIIYSPACAHIPNSSWLAARAGRGRNSPPGVWFRLSQALFTWVVLIELVTNEGSELPSGAAWAGRAGTGEIQVLPHPNSFPGPFGGTGVTVNFGSWSGKASWGWPWCLSRCWCWCWCWGSPFPALGRLDVVFLSCCRVCSARCSLPPSTPCFSGGV